MVQLPLGCSPVVSPQATSLNQPDDDTAGGKQGPAARLTISCGCGARWTAAGAAHCGCCHQTFGGVSSFDLHRSMAGAHGTCRRPADITNAAGERLLFHRNGMWRGPELDEDTKAKAFGIRNRSVR